MRPPVMQPFVDKAVGQLVRGMSRKSDVVVLGARRGDVVDALLAARLVDQLCRTAGKRKVAVALGTVPQVRGQARCDAFFKDVSSLGADAAISDLAAFLAEEIGPEAAQACVPILEVCAARRLEVVAAGVDSEVMGRVQRAETSPLAALTEEERRAYVGDSLGPFVDYSARAPNYEMYVRRVVERRYDTVVAADGGGASKSGGGGGTGAPSKAAYFASFILADGAAASLSAHYLAQHAVEDPLLVVVAPEEHVKYDLGLPGRLRDLGYAPTSILLNPTPESTDSGTKQLRLELGVAKGAPLAADYVWFSQPPRPATLTHMMNPIDGRFKIDWGLSNAEGSRRTS